MSQARSAVTARKSSAVVIGASICWLGRFFCLTHPSAHIGFLIISMAGGAAVWQGFRRECFETWRCVLLAAYCGSILLAALLTIQVLVGLSAASTGETALALGWPLTVQVRRTVDTMPTGDRVMRDFVVPLRWHEAAALAADDLIYSVVLAGIAILAKDRVRRLGMPTNGTAVALVSISLCLACLLIAYFRS